MKVQNFTLSLGSYKSTLDCIKPGFNQFSLSSPLKN